MRAPELRPIDHAVSNYQENKLEGQRQKKYNNLTTHNNAQVDLLGTTEIGDLAAQNFWSKDALVDLVLCILLAVCIISFWCFCCTIYYNLIKTRETKREFGSVISRT